MDVAKIKEGRLLEIEKKREAESSLYLTPVLYAKSLYISSDECWFH